MIRGTDTDFYVKGCISVQMRGQNMERFINISAQRDLPIKHLKSDKNGSMIFYTTPDAWKEMKSIVKKTGVSLKIISRNGLPFLLYRNRTRKLLVCGLCFFFLMIYGLTFYIWDISFEGNHRFTDEELLNYMQSIPVMNGMKKKQVSCEQLEIGIREHFNDVTWVSAEIRGTRLIVHLKENEETSVMAEKDEDPCDLIARTSGTIVKTVIRRGFCQVKEGDTVEEGDLLVDGTIPITDDFGTVMESYEVCSDAEIYAVTTHKIEERIPLTETIEVRTGKKRSGVFIGFMDHHMYLMMPKHLWSRQGGSQWEYIAGQKQLHILEDFYLPIYIGKITAYEYEASERNYRKEEVEEMAGSCYQEYIEKLQEKGIQILGNDGKIEQSESGWQITGTLTVIEDIAMKVPSVEDKSG